MTLNALSYTFLFLLYGGLALELWLNHRQRRHVTQHARLVPAAFRGHVDEAEHQRAAAYTIDHNRIRDPELVVASLLVLVWTLGGGIEWLGTLLQADHHPALGATTVIALFLINALVMLPFSAWRTFGVEGIYGFNRTTPGLYVIDRLKAATLMLLLGWPLAFGVILLMEATTHWWLWVWLLWTGFLLLAQWALPRFVLPWFNRIEPLEDQDLRRRIEGLLERIGFSARDVQVMDASRRSTHGNAFFSGIGRNRRIVFFDTLLEQLGPEETEAVLAHELGHFKLGHIRRRLIVSSLTSLLALGLLAWLAEQPFFYQGLGLSEPSSWGVLLLFLVAGPVFWQCFSPLSAWLSRRDEYAADTFAARHLPPTALRDALVRLYRDNASTLTPDPLYTAFHASHPPPVDRIQHLESLQEATPDAGRA